MRYKRKKHQDDAVKQNLAAFKHQKLSRAQNIMACGTGKTLVGMWTAESLKAKRILVAFPTLAVLAQTLKVWREQFRFRMDAYCVCSDETVAQEQRDAGEDDDSSSSASGLDEVRELAENVSTDPKELSKFIRSRRSTVKVVFCTYSSIDAVAAAKPWSFDFFLLDEAHRTACSKQGLFSTALDNTQVKAKHRLFMTATSRIFKGEYHGWVHSMCDESKFGPIVYSLNFGQAIDRGLLCDYQVVVAAIDQAEFDRYAQHFPTKVAKQPFKSAEHLGTHVVLAKAIKEHGLKRIISFHSRVSGASEFAEAFPAIVKWMPKKMRPVPPPWVGHVNARVPMDQRKQVLDDFASAEGAAVVTNARCLVEGVDIPSTDCVVFVDPKQSHIDIIQAFGRAVRLDPANPDKIGTLLIPVFLPEGADEQEALESSRYKVIWRVINALRAVDDRLAEALDYHKHHPQCEQPAAGKAFCGTDDHVELPEEHPATAVSRIREIEGTDGPNGERDWTKWVKFNLPTKVDVGFCQAIRAKVVNSPNSKIFVDVDTAIAYGVKNRLTSQHVWGKHGYPEGYPSNPDKSYNMPDFYVRIRAELGIIKEFVDVETALAYAVKHKLTNSGKWRKHSDRPCSHPAVPEIFYGMQDFFARVRAEVGTRRSRLADYESTVAYATQRGLTTKAKWRDNYRAGKAAGYPSDPSLFFNTPGFFARIRSQVDPRFVDVDTAIAYGVKNRLTSHHVWGKQKHPEGYPSNPDRSYNMPDIYARIRAELGIIKEFVDVETALAYAVKHKLVNQRKWQRRHDVHGRPKGYPYDASKHYKQLIDFFPEVRRRIEELENGQAA